MRQDKMNKIRTILSWVTTALIIFTGLLLILSCLDIYNSGDRPFTRESIAAHFHQISWVVYICIGAITCGLILHCIMPESRRRTKVVRNEKETLKRLLRTLAATNESRKEQTLRSKYVLATVLVIAASLIYPLAYYFNATNFTITNTNADVVRFVCIVAVATAISFTALFVFGNLASKSILREIEILKMSNQKKTAEATEKSNYVLLIRIAVMVAAVTCIILGVYNEGIADVLGKAIRICTECIGLG